MPAGNRGARLQPAHCAASLTVGARFAYTAPMMRLWINGRERPILDFDPNVSLLEHIRAQPGLTGTKEGCASGDCGACTVIVQDLADPTNDGAPGLFFSLNSCITPLGAMADHQVLTVEGAAGMGRSPADVTRGVAAASLHPVQAALVEHHGSQCGFCTPGFVMSLIAHQLAAGEGLGAATRADFARAISGNLCRCTGYRSILSAAAAAAEATSGGYRHPREAVPALTATPPPQPGAETVGKAVPFHRPKDEKALRETLAEAAGATPTFIAGATDLWLEVTQRCRQLGPLIDLGRVAELRGADLVDGRIRLGGAATQATLEAFFGADGPSPCPAIAALLARFGSPQIRHRATLGGNIANASPVADWPPVLLALDAELELADAAGERRAVPIRSFYLGYKETQLRPGEYIRAVSFADDLQALQVFKITKRWDDDIASVLGAFRIDVEDGAFKRVRIAFGGVAATPLQVPEVAAELVGQPVGDAAVDAATARLREVLTPITDVRASREYRLDMAEATLRKAIHRARTGQAQTLAGTLA